MSKKSHYDTLRHAGIDTNRYLSLHIDKAVIPDGAEVVVQIRDAATGKLRPVQLADVWDGCFAKNSKFYGQVMKDGHIFNPYMHRRFLPAQFRNNIRSAGYYGINDPTIAHCQKTFDVFPDKCFWFVLHHQSYIVFIKNIS